MNSDISIEGSRLELIFFRDLASDYDLMLDM